MMFPDRCRKGRGDFDGRPSKRDKRDGDERRGGDCVSFETAFLEGVRGREPSEFVRGVKAVGRAVVQVDARRRGG